MPDLYTLLELPADAEAPAIEARLLEEERTWARLARDSDPAVQERANQMLADLRLARDTLLDPERRSAYDGRRSESPAADPLAKSSPSPEPSPTPPSTPVPPPPRSPASPTMPMPTQAVAQSVTAPPEAMPPQGVPQQYTQPGMPYATGQFVAVTGSYPHGFAPVLRHRGPGAAGPSLALSGTILALLATFLPWDRLLGGDRNYWDLASSQSVYGGDSLPPMAAVAVPLTLAAMWWAISFAASTPTQGLTLSLIGIVTSLLLFPTLFGAIGAMQGNPYLEFAGADQGTAPGPIFALFGVLIAFVGNLTAIIQSATRMGA